MSCECDCASCTEFCDCQRCSKPETDLLTPPSNRPGLDSIHTRIGDYRAFFTDAKRQLSSKESPNLQALGTRDPTDPTIALLDAWSVTTDVLTFYRERLTQEAYLRTATDEVSLRQLANMVGFKPRPGIAATTHLAYLLDPSAKPVDINPGAKAQTVPLPGEKMQTFETDEKLAARAEWSQMKPRQRRPSSIDILDALTRPTIRIDDTSLFVRPGERVLFVFGLKLGFQVTREVLSAKTNIELGFVELTLKPKDDLVLALEKNKDKPNLIQQLLNERNILSTSQNADSINSNLKHALLLLSNILSSYLLGTSAIDAYNLLNSIRRPVTESDNSIQQVFNLKQSSKKLFYIRFNELFKIFEKIAKFNLHSIINNESKATSLDDFLLSLVHPSTSILKTNGKELPLSAKQGFESEGVVRIGLVQVVNPSFQGIVEPAIAAMPANPVHKEEPSIYLLRTVVSPFGAVAPNKISNTNNQFVSEDWRLNIADVLEGAAYLETVVDAITADSFAIINTPLWSNKTKNSDESLVSPERLLRFVRVRSAQTFQRGDYSISGKVTKLELADADSGKAFSVLRIN